MQEVSRYAVGLDVGTTTVRAVVAHTDTPGQTPNIIGIGEFENNGMRKGAVVNLVNVAKAVDKALEAAERMSGHQIHAATVSINGAHIEGVGSKGFIGTSGHEISEEDLLRVEDAATVMQLPANREIIEVTPRSYKLDDQANIKDPLGMTGIRLEVDAYVITALAPHLKNLHKACELTETTVHQTVMAALASARSVVSEKQMENGVVLVDLGGTTTNVAVYEEGDLQHVAVIPVGSVNITNDLAIGLKTELQIAEQVKLEHAVAHTKLRDGKTDNVTVELDKEKHEFEVADIDMIVDARLEEIFELVNAELKKIGRRAKLPGGAVITGGGAQLAGIAEYAREALQMSARVAKPEGFAGMAEQVANPAFSAAVGLMLIDLEGGPAGTFTSHNTPSGGGVGTTINSITQKITGVFGKFRT